MINRLERTPDGGCALGGSDRCLKKSCRPGQSHPSAMSLLRRWSIGMSREPGELSQAGWSHAVGGLLRAMSESGRRQGGKRSGLPGRIARPETSENSGVRPWSAERFGRSDVTPAGAGSRTLRLRCSSVRRPDGESPIPDRSGGSGAWSGRRSAVGAFRPWERWGCFRRG